MYTAGERLAQPSKERRVPKKTIPVARWREASQRYDEGQAQNLLWKFKEIAHERVRMWRRTQKFVIAWKNMTIVNFILLDKDASCEAQVWREEAENG